METLAKIALIITAVIFPFGQLFRLQYLGINFPLFDLSLIFLAFTNFLLFFKQKNKISHYHLVYFLTLNIISLIYNYYSHQYFSISSISYFLRLSSLFSLLIFNTQLFQYPLFQKLFRLTIFSTVIFGIIQYLIWPNFTYFDALNWDPHLHRLVGTFFDPTFTALIYLFFIINLYFSKIDSRGKNLLIAISYIAMALTYSRSTLLAFFITFSFIFLKNKSPRKIFIIGLLCFATILLLPRKEGEGTKLERTSSIRAKIENYQKGLNHFKKSPLIGVGYNNIPQSRPDQNPLSHANTGYDSSLLTLLVSTGLIGFIIFIIATKPILKNSNLYQKSLIISLFAHSLFANSLLYPWILFYLITQIKTRK
jgi:hypothetical protein